MILPIAVFNGIAENIIYYERKKILHRNSWLSDE